MTAEVDLEDDEKTPTATPAEEVEGKQEEAEKPDQEVFPPEYLEEPDFGEETSAQVAWCLPDFNTDDLDNLFMNRKRNFITYVKSSESRD